MATDPGDLVLDPTCGSGTTAYVAEQWGRRWITIDTSRVALALARTRLMAARYPWYLLADSREGRAKEAELTQRLPADTPIHDDIRQGFVYERVPHITLKSIANNPLIDDIGRSGRRCSNRCGQLNSLKAKNWEEWEIPRKALNPWSENDTKSWAIAHSEQQPFQSGKRHSTLSTTISAAPSHSTLNRPNLRSLGQEATVFIPDGGKPASPDRRKSTSASPPAPKSNISMTSPTSTMPASASPGRSRSKACRPTACCRRAKRS